MAQPLTVLEQRERDQRLRHAYRSAADRLYQGIYQNEHSNVQPCETGAFVEINVWIPKAAAEKDMNIADEKDIAKKLIYWEGEYKYPSGLLKEGAEEIQRLRKEVAKLETIITTGSDAK